MRCARGTGCIYKPEGTPNFYIIGREELFERERESDPDAEAGAWSAAYSLAKLH